MILYSFSLSFYSLLHLLSLHSFPTRRSSDLFFKARLIIQFLLSSQPFLKFCKYIGRSESYFINAYFLTVVKDRKSTRLNSSHVAISYAVFCLKKKNNHK